MEPETELKPTWGWRAVCGVWTGIIAAIVASDIEPKHWDLTVGFFVLSGVLAASLCLAHYTRRVLYGWKTRLFLAALGGLFTYFLLVFFFSLALATTYVVFVSGESDPTLQTFIKSLFLIFLFNVFGVALQPIWIGSAVAMEGAALIWERFIDQRIST